MKVSVIIPVYKVEQYLDECLQSVFRQTYPELEIILVDDGSPDRCPELCDNYAKTDDRLTVIHKENGGLSDARNAGLKIATGDYVIFLDSDDFWIDNELITTLTNEINKDLDTDIVLFRRKDFWDKSTRVIESQPFEIQKINGQTRNDIFRSLVLSHQFNMSACFQMIRKELLLANDILFIKGQLSEDIDWSLRLWNHASTIRATNIVGYAYRHRTHSITMSYSLRNQLDFASTLSKWQKIAEHNMIDKELARLYLGYLAYLYPTLLRNYYLVLKKDRKNEYKVLKPLISLIQYSITPKSDHVKIIHCLFGFRITCTIFGLFGLIRKRGWKGLLKINN